MCEDILLDPSMLSTRAGSYIGKTFHTKYKSTLTIVGVSAKEPTRHGRCVYVATCSVCSIDKELWPLGSIATISGSYNSGSAACGCPHNPKWKDWQYKIILDRYCEKNKYELVGAPKIVDGSTLVTLHNPNTDNTWNYTLLEINSDKRDPKGHMYTEATMYDKCVSFGNFNKGCEFKKVSRDKWRMFCPQCAEDVYAKAGLCDGWFNTICSSLTVGKNPCRCNGVFRYTEDKRKLQLSNICEGIGGSFIEFISPYKNSFTEFKWRCSKGHINITPVGEFLQGSRCNICNKNGFRTTLQGTIYIVRWEGCGQSFLKFGITNREVYQRLKEPNRHSSLDYTILYTKTHHDGTRVFKAERELKQTMCTGACPKDLLPQGHTETVEDTEENIKEILRIINKHL